MSCLVQASGFYLLLEKDTTAVKLKPKYTFRQYKELEQFLFDTRARLINKGYLEASFDSLSRQGDTVFARLHTGKQYEVDYPVVYTKRKAIKTAPSLAGVDKQLQEQLRQLENNGYPFAKVSTDSVLLTDTSLTLQYAVEKGRFITIDSFINHGSSKITKGFIQNYIGIKSGKPYSESRIREIDKLLQKLPYATVRQPSSILFREEKADIHLYLDKRKVNSFDFLVGFLPGSNNGKILITGEVRVHLQNAFRRGEEVFLQWQRLQPQSQMLDIRFNYPYLLNAPLGVNFTFKLDKRDSSSLDLAWQLGLPYMTKSNNYIKGFYKYFQTIILAADTTFAKLNKRLPNNLDAVNNQYGIQAYYESLDYLFNPRKGFELKITGSAGVKKIRPNNQITTLSDPFSPEFNYAGLYDSIQKKSVKGDVFWMGNYYLPMGKKQRHIFRFGLNGGAVFNRDLLRNELIRIGGNKLLRGFDEQSIFASAYQIGTLEYRMIVQRNSYFFVFLDAAYVRQKFDRKITQDFPFGVGAGITFETKIGIFGLTYALGQQKYQKMDFRNSKLHFGYVAVF
jgi:outer membrane translocation and assembly module TamA